MLHVPPRLLRRTPFPGGAPANVATGVARLGAGALFVSAIGKDDLGDDFVALLKGANRCVQQGVGTADAGQGMRPGVQAGA